MMFRRFSVVLAAVLLAGVVNADEAELWIAKARSFLGSEAALNKVQSLHFEGSLAGTELVPDPADPKKMVEQPVKITIDIVFQRPMQQRQIVRSDRIERVSALDNYDGWEKLTELGSKNPPRLTLLDTSGIKRLRATTIENLSFYSTQGGFARKVTFLGEARVDGIDCVKLSFSHSDQMVFLRYFEKSTGRLVKSEIEGGGEIREEGELVVDGIRFPRQVVNRTANGRSTTITFDRVTVNEKFAPEVFAVPELRVK